MRRQLIVLILFLMLYGCSGKESQKMPELDLTDLSDTMAYSQLINIIKEPQDYLGKTIILTGIFTAPFNGFSHQYNYTVTIQDNTQCCAQGIEFLPQEKLRFPDDFPEEGEMITVRGILSLFEEGKHAYCLIEDAVFEMELSG